MGESKATCNPGKTTMSIHDAWGWCLTGGHHHGSLMVTYDWWWWNDDFFSRFLMDDDDYLMVNQVVAWSYVSHCLGALQPQHYIFGVLAGDLQTTKLLLPLLWMCVFLSLAFFWCAWKVLYVLLCFSWFKRVFSLVVKAGIADCIHHHHVMISIHEMGTRSIMQHAV